MRGRGNHRSRWSSDGWQCHAQRARPEQRLGAGGTHLEQKTILAGDVMHFERFGDARYLRVAFQAIENGRGRVFLENLGRARRPQLGGLPPESRRKEQELLTALAEKSLLRRRIPSAFPAPTMPSSSDGPLLSSASTATGNEASTRQRS